MKDNLAVSTDRATDFNLILRFFVDGDITLNADQEVKLQRWIFCHKLILQKKLKEAAIVDKLKKIYNISEFTARADIFQCQALFGMTIRTNKKFILHHHAEDIKMTIERFKLDKSLVHLVPKLMDSYTKAVLAMPDELNKDKMPPPVMIFNVVAGQSIQTPKNFDEALASIKRRQQHQHEYVKDEYDQPSE